MIEITMHNSQNNHLKIEFIDYAHFKDIVYIECLLDKYDFKNGKLHIEFYFNLKQSCLNNYWIEELTGQLLKYYPKLQSIKIVGKSCSKLFFYNLKFNLSQHQIIHIEHHNKINGPEIIQFT